MIRWAFLDVGNILLDEDPIAYHCTRLHWEAVRRAGSGLTFHELIAAREERAMRGSRWPLYDVVSGVLDESACAAVWDAAEREIRARFAELSPVIDGARELVERLAKGFRLGLIANQGTECRAWLDHLGLLPRFEVVLFSEEVRIFKPDPALYRRALERAGATPEQSVMIGDRLDNDIDPAGTLGMATIWVRWRERANKGWRPAEPEAIAFRNSLQTASVRSPALSRGAVPSLIVDCLHAIDPEQVARLTVPRH